MQIVTTAATGFAATGGEACEGQSASGPHRPPIIGGTVLSSDNRKHRYRGVKLIANQHGRRGVLLDGGLSRLIADDDWPVLLSVRLPFGAQDRRFVERWGWIPGMGHSVVVLGRTNDGNLIVGDPAVGLEIWSEVDLDLLWQGVGMRVE